MHPKQAILVFLSMATAASCLPADGHAWKAPGPNDRRSPCPMVNTLANHGFLPRSGLNITMDTLVAGLTAGVNLAPDATRLVGAKALTAGENGVSFNLDDLNKHGVIEHDGSLSRADAAVGDNHSFDPAIWAGVAAHFTEPKISIATAAAARRDRLTAAKAANPAFSMSASDVQFSMIETALYLRVFGNGTVGEAERTWVRTLFEQERLPYEEGWRRSETPLATVEILGLVNKIAVA